MTDHLKLGRASELRGQRGYLKYRLFEIIPGLITWITLLGVVIGTFIAPVAAAVFIIIFDMYWLIKTLYLSIHMRVSFTTMRRNMKKNWLEEVKQVSPANYQVPGLKHWSDIFHLIIIPAYKEGVEIIEATLEGLARSNYPATKLIVVLAQEARAGTDFNKAIEEHIRNHYSNRFYKLAFTQHPDKIEGEIIGKGSNATWAGRYAKKEIVDAIGLQYSRVITSVLDSDTVVYPDYFACVTHAYLTTQDPLHTSYQPIPFFINNIWEAPAFARVVAFSSTFWQKVQQQRPERLVTFSSHSMPFQAVVDIDFWQTNMVSEDSRVFWQCYFRYEGNYKTKPLLYPVSMDANVAPTFWQTMINVYKQHRRWAYGVENIPYFMYGFSKSKRIKFKDKIYHTFVLMEGFWSLATNPLILFILGWLPLIVGGAVFHSSVIAVNLPRLTAWIMNIANIGLITSAILSTLLLPPRPPQYGPYKHILMILQWALFPITIIIFSAIPGVDAQTRLMFGKYMGFWFTPKSRHKAS